MGVVAEGRLGPRARGQAGGGAVPLSSGDAHARPSPSPQLRDLRGAPAPGERGALVPKAASEIALVEAFSVAASRMGN